VKVVRAVGLAARLGATGVVVRHVVQAARRADPIAPSDADHGPISVVVPARDEAARIGPLLATVVGAPGVAEVVVVDDESTDATADVARTAGAHVVTGRPVPAGWAGKTWALQQGLDAATGEWVVLLDADTRPAAELPRALVARCVADGLDLLTVSGHFDCPTPWVRWLHPALLTTLVYRAAPPGALDQGPSARRVGNGQCMAARTSTLRAAGAFASVAHHTVEDVALVRAMATAGQRVGYLDASSLLTVRMYETAGEAWHGWGRSLALPGVDPRWRQLAGLGTVALTQAAPLARLLARRADVLDLVLLTIRLGTLAGTAPAYRRRGVAYWLSPLADVVAVGALVRSTVASPRAWRGRTAVARVVSASPSRSGARPAT
jgi:dolichol-phosphate mannosyltransferase